MPRARARGGHELYWEEVGTGEPGADPVLLIMGLAGSSRAWSRLLPHIAAEHRTILFDNRGTGRSDAVGGPLTMDDLATDALAVLNDAQVERAHVFGVSLGGMIAQHLALDHRARVRSLLLGCTTAGGPAGPPWRLVASLALRPLVGAGRTWSLVVPALYAPGTRRDRPEWIAEDLRVRNEDATSPRTSMAQSAAALRHDVRGRLHELAGLTCTVMHGEQDTLILPRRGRALASAIPGARFVEIPAAGHMLSTDAEQATATAVAAHFEVACARVPARA